MNKHIQIRNVPPALHRRLKVRAAQRGLTLSDYLREEMERLAKLPTLEEWAELVQKRESSNVSVDDIVTAIREGREEHDQAIDRRLKMSRRVK